MDWCIHTRRTPDIAAVAHDPFGGLRSRDDHHAVDAARDGLQVWITAIAIEGLQVWIDREDIVARLLQPVIDQIARRMVAVVARHAYNGDPLLGEEIVHFGFESCWAHWFPQSAREPCL